MKVDFVENISSDIISLVSGLPSLFEEIVPQGLSRFDQMTIRITDMDEFQCEMAFDSVILISQKTIEIIWSLNLAHINFYDIFCKGKQPLGKLISLQADQWNLIKDQLTWAADSLKGDKPDFSNSFDRHFFGNNHVGRIFHYTLLYFISHELFHLIHNDNHDTAIEEERQCDFSATNFIINAQNDNEYLERAKGVALGLMVLNVYGIHRNKYDGITHPFTYDRMIENILLVFGKENDKIWGFVMALFALHCTEKKLEFPKGEFNNFYDCMLAYKEILIRQSN